MNDVISPTEAQDERTYRATFGVYNQTGPWTDVRDLTWRQIEELLTTHKVGPKAGSCIVPAIFRGTQRVKEDAEGIDVVLLDSDTGVTCEEIAQALSPRGLQGIVASTHSHLSTRTIVKRSHWARFRARVTDPTATAFLEQEKGYLSRVASGAVIEDDGKDAYVTFNHQPCPKFRIAIPLERPWLATNYRSQDEANAAWKERVEALAAALELRHDQACTDTSRLFYLPRHSGNGPTPEIALVDGRPCDIFSLPPAAGHEHTARQRKSRRHAGDDDARVYTDPATGATVDLREWVADYGGRFQIVDALRARQPDIFTGKIAGGVKTHIRCVNEDAHTQGGVDAATIVINSSTSTSAGFVYHCRHAHCEGRDRLYFLHMMLVSGWLKIADLTDPRFLTNGIPNDEIELSEHGIAQAFAAAHGDKLRYCHSTGSWYVWDGSHWSRNQTRLPFHWARELANRLSQNGSRKARIATRKASVAGAVERFAQADTTFAVTNKNWDRDPWLLGTPNGTIDLRSGELISARRADFITRQTAVAPATRADCQKFLEFLDQICGGDHGLVSFVRRWFGYCLTGITNKHALIFIFGPGGNGKSVLLNTVAQIMGSYAATAAMDTFAASKGERHPTYLAVLNGPRLVLTTETEEGVAWAEEKIKLATGGDTMTARLMRQDFFEFVPVFKLTVSGNHKPILRNVDNATRRRFLVVPFTYVPARPNKDLMDELKAEWPGILRWMIEGCLMWQRDGLLPPTVVLSSTDAYFSDQDVITQWIEECCELRPDVGASNSALFASWRDFSSQRGEDQRSSIWLSGRLDQRDFKRDKDCEHFRGRGFRGIRVVRARARSASGADRSGT